MSHVRLVYLESDDVDAVLGVLRELQSMPRGFEPSALPARVKTVAAVLPDASAPVIEQPTAKPAKPAQGAPAGGKRAVGVGDAVLAAFKSTTEPDRKQLARDLYGDASSKSTARVGKTIWNLVRDGKLKPLATGGYKVVG